MFYLLFSLQSTTQFQLHSVIKNTYGKVYHIYSTKHDDYNVINSYSLNYAKQLIT